MGNYELLPHTADVAIKVTAATKVGLLSAAIQGMCAYSAPQFAGDEERTHHFLVKAADFPSLLIDTLNDIIGQASAGHEAYETVRFDLLTDTQAEGTATGRPIKGFGTEIKAATHHGLKVEKNEEGKWETTIVFDV